MANWRDEAVLIEEPKWRSEAIEIEADDLDSGYSFDDPNEYEKQLKETLDIADEMELAIEDAEYNYNNITQKPGKRPPSKAQTSLVAVTPTKWEKFKDFFVGRRPPLPPDADRIEKVTRAFDIGISAPLRTFLKLGKGMTLGAPDLMWAALKRITPEDMWVDEVKDMTLDEAMDWAGGYDPSGFQKSVGEVAEFIGRLRTVAPIAQKIGIIGNTPKDITVLDKAFETAKLFGAAAVGEQASKYAAEKIDPTETEYGFEGPKAVLRDMAIGAAFSLIHSGVKGAWSKITPKEQRRALKLLGLKKKSSIDEIRAAARTMAKKYHPDKVKGFRTEFENVIKARDALIKKAEVKDIVFRGQKIQFKPKLLPGETVEQQATRLAEVGKKAPAAEITPVEQAKRVKEMIIPYSEARSRMAAEMEKAEGPKKTKLQKKLDEMDAQAAEHLASIAQEGLKEPVAPKAPAERVVAPAEAKQPWEMTRGEFGPYMYRKTLGEMTSREMDFAHKREVKQAIEQGKPVPREVLEEYKSEPWAKEAPAQLSDKEFPEIYRRYGKITADAEKNKFRLMTQKEQDLWKQGKNWEEFSRKQGYSEEEIEDFRYWTQLNDDPRAMAARGFEDLPELERNEAKLAATEAEEEMAAKLAAKPAIAKRKAEIEGDLSKTKVVDIEGKPLVVYHGTIGEFDKFEIGHRRRGHPGLYGQGFYFTPSPDEAGAYAMEAAPSRYDISGKEEPLSANIIPAYLNIENPLIIERDMVKVTNKAGVSFEVTTYTDKAVKKLRELGIKVDEDYNGQQYKIGEYGKEVSDKIIAAGYDGVIAKKPDGSIIEIAAFYPEQIIPKYAIEKPEITEGGRLMFGIDPGIDKFVAQSVKPAVINAYKAVKALGKFAVGVPKFSARVFLQPSLELEQKSPDAYVAVMKAIHTAQDAAKLDFKTMPVEAMDMNIEQIRTYFDSFTKEQQYDFMVSFAGQPGTPDAILMQKEAFDRLPKELQDPKVIKAIREIADKNFDYLVDVVGPNVGLVPDYFYGVFKSKKTVDKFWDHWTSTDKFTKKKLIPSIADAINYGLESGTEIRPRYDNYVDNLMAEYLGIARLDQMKQLKARLIELGSAGTKKPPSKAKGKKRGTVIEQRAAKLAEIYGSAKEALKLQELQYKVSGVKELTQQEQATLDALKKLIAKEKEAGKVIRPPADESLDQLREKSEAEDADVNVIHPEDINFYITEDPEMAPAGWMGVADPVFRGAWVRPDLARLINNLTATNKITQSAILNPVRQFNNKSRFISFALSGFHMRNVTMAAIADSGFGGPVLHPVRALKPVRNWPSTKQWKKIQQTPEYKRLLRLGTGLGYSYEEDVAKTFDSYIDYVNKNNMLGATGKLIETGLRIPQAFQKWQFDIYIPMLKHQANLDAWAALEKKTGRDATDADLIDIIKATQNIYGEMNERVLGRSATQTSGSRFVMKAPGYAEGNTRTNIDAGTKWRGDRAYTRGWRARTQIINSLLVKRVIAIAGTLWLTGKLPKMLPERKEDIPDLFKIDTGRVDGRGRRIMYNTLDSDKDYLDLWFNLFILRPDEALYDSFNRLGGMKSILAEFVYDGFTSMMGQRIRDWKGDTEFSLSDTALQKIWKYTVIAIDRQQPIATSVFQQMRRKEISRVQSFLGAIAGVRPTWSEYDRREGEFYRLIFEQKADLEKLDTFILGIAKPRKAYENYNKAVDRILDAKLLPEGFKERYGPELYRDVDEYLQNKAETASHWATTEKDKAITERAVRVLKHFGISAEEAVKLRDQRKRRMQKEAFEKKYSKTAEELAKDQIEKKSSIANILRDKRLKERMESE